MNGDLFDNIPHRTDAPTYTDNCYDGTNTFVQMWPCPPGTRDETFDDGVDAKDSSSIIVTGTLRSPGQPLDYNFGHPNAPPSSGPAVNGTETISYGKLDYPAMGYTSDPLAATLGSAPVTAGCGGTPTTYTSQGASGGPFFPGVYTFPVDVTGAVGAGPAAPTFMDCGGGSPGVYVFEQGVHIHPAAGGTVYGNNVLFVMQRPIPDSALPQNNGAGTLSGAPTGGTYPDSTSPMPSTGPDHTGMDLSLDIGGNGTVVLTAPTAGRHAGTVLWQTPGVLANFGFDNAATDSTATTLNGNVDNSTLANGISAPLCAYTRAGTGFPTPQEARSSWGRRFSSTCPPRRARSRSTEARSSTSSSRSGTST